MSVADVPATAPFTVPRDVCRDFERSSRLEWLETNHTGAFAMGTVSGVNTRRYHALLIASLNPPADRYSILPRIEEQVTTGAERFQLAAVQYPGALAPRGFDLLEQFAVDPFPTWRYACGGTAITKTVCLLDRQQTVLVKYESSNACRLDARLFVAFRDYHALARENSAFQTHLTENPGSISIQPYSDLPPLALFHSGRLCGDGIWYRNHEYLRELERGLDFREDLFSPGSIQFELDVRQPAWLIATLEPDRLPSPRHDSHVDSLLAAEANRRQFGTATQLESTLIRALDQFRITRADGRSSLIAGYPWFTDWSRDTLISAPALRVAGFPHSETKEILQMLARERSQGLLPNRFSDTHSLPEYNTADASLWWFVAAHDFIEHTHDVEFLREAVYPAAIDIVQWHQRGTQYDIHVDAADHLVWAGNAATQLTATQLTATQLTATQLTWMDARVAGAPVTPRAGKPVEVNALWYNALRILAHWSEMLGLAEQRHALESEAAVMLPAFEAAFWNPERRCLYDVVTQSAPDASLRPNQLFALSLPFPLLNRDRARSVVEVVKKELLTPTGLRTLERADPAYRPRFEGSMRERDGAYHQGTVWPWLIGPFIAAYLYAYGESQETIEFCREITRHLEGELNTCCLGSPSEVYDGDPPHRPGGCPAQLWSVAQLIATLARLGSWKPPDPLYL